MGALAATYACAVARDLTTPQAAAFLGVGSNGIRAWTEAGHIRHTLTPGGHRRFEQADLEAWRAGQRPPAARHAAEIRADVWTAAAAIQRARTPRSMSGPLPIQTGRARNEPCGRRLTTPDARLP